MKSRQVVRSALPKQSASLFGIYFLSPKRFLSNMLICVLIAFCFLDFGNPVLLSRVLVVSCKKANASSKQKKDKSNSKAAVITIFMSVHQWEFTCKVLPIARELQLCWGCEWMPTMPKTASSQQDFCMIYLIRNTFKHSLS